MQVHAIVSGPAAARTRPAARARRTLRGAVCEGRLLRPLEGEVRRLRAQAPAGPLRRGLQVRGGSGTLPGVTVGRHLPPSPTTTAIMHIHRGLGLGASWSWCPKAAGDPEWNLSV